MRELELFPETDVYEELMERASELTSMLLAMRDMLIKLANESEDLSPERLDAEIATIEAAPKISHLSASCCRAVKTPQIIGAISSAPPILPNNISRISKTRSRSSDGVSLKRRNVRRRSYACCFICCYGSK
jgi:hypothetical protein